MKKLIILTLFTVLFSLNGQSQTIDKTIFESLKTQFRANSFPLSQNYKMTYSDDNKEIYEFTYEKSNDFEYPKGMLIVEKTSKNYEYITSYSQGRNFRKIIINKEYVNTVMTEIFNESIMVFLNGKKVLEKKY
jgi:hypothetical protein